MKAPLETSTLAVRIQPKSENHLLDHGVLHCPSEEHRLGALGELQGVIRRPGMEMRRTWLMSEHVWSFDKPSFIHLFGRMSDLFRGLSGC